MKLNHRKLAQAAGLECFDKNIIDALDRFADLVADANRRINIMSRANDPLAELQKQVAISLAILRLIDLNRKTWIDIGSGGGFPVIPLAITCPTAEFTAVEPISKSAYFLERTAQELSLGNMSVVNSRVERLYREGDPPPWQVVSVKAVAELDESLEWSSHLIGSGGIMVTYKPRDLSEKHRECVKERGFEHISSLNLREVIDVNLIFIVLCKKR